MDKKPTLVIYLPSLESGGAERLHLHLAPALIEAGYAVTFLVHRAQGSLLPLLSPQFRLVSLDTGRTLQGLLPLIHFLKREQPDILLSNLGHNNILALWARKLARVKTKIIVSQHNTLSAQSGKNASWQHRILPLLYRLFLSQADGIVAVSQGVADDLAQVTGLARERIEVIYNPVIFKDFEARLHTSVEHPWIGQGLPPYFIAVGRLTAQKDFSTLIHAFAIIAKQSSARLMILGEGPEHKMLEALVLSLGLAGRVRLEGYVENPLPYMRCARALVLSSRYEGFGNVLAEALAAGTQVIATDCSHGPAEILAHGQYGRLVPVGDREAMADAMREALDQPRADENLQARGREFTVERAARQYVELFEYVL